MVEKGVWSERCKSHPPAECEECEENGRCGREGGREDSLCGGGMEGGREREGGKERGREGVRTYIV